MSNKIIKKQIVHFAMTRKALTVKKSSVSFSDDGKWIHFKIGGKMRYVINMSEVSYIEVLNV